jgi:hypothetical protein
MKLEKHFKQLHEREFNKKKASARRDGEVGFYRLLDVSRQRPSCPFIATPDTHPPTHSSSPLLLQRHSCIAQQPQG